MKCKNCKILQLSHNSETHDLPKGRLQLPNRMTLLLEQGGVLTCFNTRSIAGGGRLTTALYNYRAWCMYNIYIAIYALKYDVMQNPKPTSIHASPCWALSRISCIWQGQKRTRFCHYFFCNDLLTEAALSPRDIDLERFDTVSIRFQHFHVNTFSFFCLSLLSHVEPNSGKQSDSARTWEK